MKTIKNDDWVYPKNTIPPKWVVEKIISAENVCLSSTKETRNKNMREWFKKNIPVDFDFPLNKSNLTPLLQKLYDKFGADQYNDWLYFFTIIGGVCATVKGVTLNLETLLPPKWVIEERDKLVKQLKNKEISEVEFEEKLDKLGQKYIDYLKEIDDGSADIILSGSKGKASDIRKMILGVGLSITYEGKVNDVIDKSGVEGLDATQYYNYSSPAALTQYNKSVKTADPGYLIKLLILVLGNIKLSRIYDCKATKGVTLPIENKQLIKDLEGKRIMKGTLKEGNKVTFRSALYCEAEDGICTVCYNELYVKRFGIEPGTNIGLKASSAFATPLTGLALKGSHIGVSLNKEAVNFKKDIKSKELHQYFDIQEDKIIAKYKSVVTINKEDYIDDNLIDNGDSLSIASVDIEVNDKLFTIDLGYNINLQKTEHYKEDKNEITIIYDPDDVIITGEYKDTATSVAHLKRLLNGGIKHIKGISHLLLALHNELSKNGPAPIHHLELMLHNLFVEFDDKHKMWIPVRLGDKKYTPDHRIDLITAIHRLTGAEAEIAGYQNKVVMQQINTKKPTESDYSKLMRGDIEDMEGPK